jgi:23S rRNA (uridine2552-2'-O)-methyltransferase
MYIRKDGYYRLAKQQGYRSRASFKLIQLNNSYHIIQQGNRVLDIGASPGGWMQVIIDTIGKRGTVVGIDILDIPAINAPNAVTIKGDINDPLVRQKAVYMINGKFDTVVSDLSINITGNASFDTYRNLEMAKLIISFLPELLKNNGNFLIKLFYSNELKSFLKPTEVYFKTIYTTKPLASRSSSSELYMIGKGFKPVHYPHRVEGSGRDDKST